MKPRVLVFHPALAPYRVDLFNELARRLDIRVIFLQENLASQSFDQAALLEKLDADHDYLVNGFSLRGRLFRLGVGRAINEFRPDVVVSHEYSQVTISVAVHKRLSRVAFKHVVWTADNPGMVINNGILRGMVKRFITKGLDGMLVYSGDTLEAYRKYFGIDYPVGVVPNIQSEKEFCDRVKGCDKEVLLLIKKYNLYGKQVLLYVGRLAREKRVDRLIDVYKELCDRYDDLILAIVGDGKERHELTAMAERAGIGNRVIFHGRAEGMDLAAWFRVATLFVLPSEYEPFGAVVNEALVAGVPVICSDAAGAKVLIEEGINGAVVDASNPVELKKSIEVWFGKGRKVLSKNAPGTAGSLMSIEFDDVVDSYVSLINKVHHAGTDVPV